MKVLHLMLACFYIDNYSYQENYLPKHHKLQGHDVEIVASLANFDENGKAVRLPHADKYINEYGIPVTRLEYADGKFGRRLRRYKGLEAELERIQPELIFIHGVQFMDIDIVVKYCKAHPEVKVFADNHSDFSNSATNWLSKNILHKIIWRSCAQKIDPYVTKFYGVLPARVDFLANVYGLPREKIELLVMGADDESVAAATKPEVRQKIRQQYGLAEDDFVIMTGGKIDKNKPQTLILMDAVNSMREENIKLLVFGVAIPELQEAFNAKLSDRVQYIGWKRSDQIYSEFAAADMLAFPGLHSVLWEQAVGMGKPCIFRKIEGFTHVDLDGNCIFFEDDTAQGYARVIREAIQKKDALKQCAEAKGLDAFSYDRIAYRSIMGGK